MANSEIEIHCSGITDPPLPPLLCTWSRIVNTHVAEQVSAHAGLRMQFAAIFHRWKTQPKFPANVYIREVLKHDKPCCTTARRPEVASVDSFGGIPDAVVEHDCRVHSPGNLPPALPMTEPGTSHPSPLPRGQACTPCRRRKIRCDGGKPSCNQCTRFGREDECEYSGVSIPSTARVLEQNIARLQSRIQELEQDPTIVRLHDPHTGSSTASTQSIPWWELPEPPPDVAHSLTNIFLPYASRVGFFLDSNRFFTAMFNPTVSKPRPPTVLRNVVYLWGLRLSESDQFTRHETVFVDRVSQSIHSALSSPQHSDKLYVLQAEILLSYYFLHNGRFVEGKYHTNAAVSLALLCHLHKIGTVSGRGIAGPTTQLVPMLPPPRDTLEEGERIRAWWSTFILDKSWVVAFASPSAITEDENNMVTMIETPWPFDQDDQHTPSRGNSGRTTSRFMSSLASGRLDTCTSILGLHSQAAFLYEKAARLASLLERNAALDQNDFVALDTYIERFKQALPTLDNVDPSSRTIHHDVLVVHSISQGTTIQLHSGLAQHNQSSRTKCLAAANIIVRLLNSIPYRDLKLVNPIMAVQWDAAAGIIVKALQAVRSMRSAWASSSALPGEDGLRLALQQLSTVIEHFSRSSPLMNAQLLKLRQAQLNA
ncbi:hypothetical protein ABKN59_006375 [Abortiporus biennis]